MHPHEERVTNLPVCSDGTSDSRRLRGALSRVYFWHRHRCTSNQTSTGYSAHAIDGVHRRLAQCVDLRTAHRPCRAFSAEGGADGTQMIATAAPPQLLLALQEGECAPSCLQRAYDLTCALGAELQVLRVLPSPWTRVLRRDPAKGREHVRASLRATRMWLARAFGEEPPPGKVLVQEGPFVEAVVEYARSAEVELIVVPRQVGALAPKLASRTGVKVLVAREPGPRNAILAATDLASPGFPVLEQAARFGLALDATLTAFHNVDPLMVADRAAARLAPGVATALTGAQCQVRLADAVRSLPLAATPVVRVEIDPVYAILEEARRHDVDIVVVGIHARSPFERLLRGSVAARVVRKSQRCVLLTPIC